MGNQTVLEKITDREMETGDYLKEVAPTIGREQKHLEQGTEARAYWHYGYMIAMRDVRKLLREQMN